MSSEGPGSFVASLRRELVFHCDAGGTIVTADTVADRLVPGALGKTLTSLALPGTEGKIDALLERAAKETVLGWEVSIVADGKPRTISFAAGPCGDGTCLVGTFLSDAQMNAVAQMAAATSEISALKRVSDTKHDELLKTYNQLADSNRGLVALHAELDEKNDSLQRNSNIKSRVVASVSHEFRTPINSILGITQLLLDRLDGDLTSEQEKQLRFVRTSGEALSGLVNDLLDLSKIESGKYALRVEDGTVEELFASIRGMMRPLFTNPDVQLVVDTPRAPVALRTDQGKIAQILRNLVSNASKFTEKGSVQLGARLEDGQRVTFYVKDTGIGIAPKDQDGIFEEFSQIDSPVQRRVRGTGLGLALSRKLAEVLGGTLTVSSRLDEGSTFTLTVPLVHEEVVEMEVIEKKSELADPTKIPVLVVEDDRQTMFLYERYLSSAGFQVFPARSIEGAKAILERVRPVAIVLDVMLEGETTWALVEEIKENPDTRDIPLMVVTVVDSSQRARALGADEFWLKPINGERLIRKLSELAKRGPMTKVLVIDDDEASRYLIRRFLEGTDYRVIETGDATEEGEARAARGAPRHLARLPPRRRDRVRRHRRPSRWTRRRAGSPSSSRRRRTSTRRSGHACRRRRPRSSRSRTSRASSRSTAFATRSRAPASRCNPPRVEGRMAEANPDKVPLILCVNDVESARYLITRIVRSVGWRVIEASNGIDALRMAREQMPDLAVLDVKLPDLLGYEVCRRLKDDEATSGIAVIQTSATFVTSEGKARGLDSGADAYLTQPFESIELIAMVRSLLRLRRTETELRERASTLAENDRRKDEFLAMLAHELRNPLSAILVASNLMERDDADLELMKRVGKTIGRQARHLGHLVDDLLDVSRITRGKIQLTRKRLDLRALVANVLDGQKNSLDKRQHHLTTHLPPDSVWVDADETRLEQVLGNLIGNAAKYTAAGGRIQVSLGVRGVAEAPDRAVVRIRDTGVGIAKEDIHSVWDLFYQVDSSLARQQSGLGIGLTMVRRLVEMHGGTVGVSSDGVDHGTDFWFELPLVDPPPELRLAPSTDLAPRPLRLLLVDDNLDSCELYAYAFEQMGHDVVSANDGEEGLRLLLTGDFDAAVVDIGLPGLDGYEVARRVRSELGKEGPFLIALTGYGRPEDKARALEAGFDRHCVKPIDVVEVSRLLPKHGKNRTLATGSRHG